MKLHLPHHDHMPDPPFENNADHDPWAFIPAETRLRDENHRLREEVGELRRAGIAKDEELARLRHDIQTLRDEATGKRKRK